MRVIVLTDGRDQYLEQAVEASGFPITMVADLGPLSQESLEYPTKKIKCPPTSGAARTSIYLMQIQKADCVIMVGVEWELVNLALSFDLPIYALHVTDDYVVGLRWMEEDF